jgi:hypothetical protein
MTELPSVLDLQFIVDTGRVDELLTRAEVATAPAGWWSALIAAGNSAFVAALETDPPAAAPRAAALVRVLDVARSTGALGPEETVHRKLIAKLAVLRTLGPLPGDELRDPAAICRDFVQGVGMSWRDYQSEVDKLRTAAVTEDTVRRRAWLLRIGEAVRALAELPEYAMQGCPDAVLEAEVAGWLSVAGQQRPRSEG